MSRDLPPSPPGANGDRERVARPLHGRAILLISAPKSASSLPQYSPPTPFDNSRILNPLKADICKSPLGPSAPTRSMPWPRSRNTAQLIVAGIVDACQPARIDDDGREGFFDDRRSHDLLARLKGGNAETISLAIAMPEIRSTDGSRVGKAGVD